MHPLIYSAPYTTKNNARATCAGGLFSYSVLRNVCFVKIVRFLATFVYAVLFRLLLYGSILLTLLIQIVHRTVLLFKFLCGNTVLFSAFSYFAYLLNGLFLFFHFPSRANPSRLEYHLRCTFSYRPFFIFFS